MPSGTPAAWETVHKAVTVGGVLMYEVEVYKDVDGHFQARSRTRGEDGFDWTEWHRVPRRFLRREGLLP